MPVEVEKNYDKDTKEYMLKIVEKLHAIINNEISDIQNMDFEAKMHMFDCLLSGATHFYSEFLLYSMFAIKNKSANDGKECCKTILDEIYKFFLEESKGIIKLVDENNNKLDDHKKWKTLLIPTKNLMINLSV